MEEMPDGKRKGKGFGKNCAGWGRARAPGPSQASAYGRTCGTFLDACPFGPNDPTLKFQSLQCHVILPTRACVPNVLPDAEAWQGRERARGRMGKAKRQRASDGGGGKWQCVIFHQSSTRIFLPIIPPPPSPSHPSFARVFLIPPPPLPPPLLWWWCDVWCSGGGGGGSGG